MTSSHTPAPWDFYEHLTASENHRGFRVRHAVSNRVTNVADVMPVDEDGSEGEANAKLIAAAPELLEALQNSLSIMEMQQKTEVFKQYERASDWDKPIAVCRAAIAKATA